MKNLIKLVAKHKLITFLILCLLTCLPYTVLFSVLNFPLWIIIIVNLFLLLLNYLFVVSSEIKINDDAVKALNNFCDPIPLLEASEFILKYKKSGPNNQIALSNYSTATRELGDVQKAYDILSSINIDKFPGVLAESKFVYYNNLSCFCSDLDKHDLAEVWYNKSLQIYNDIKNIKFKNDHKSSILYLTALRNFRNKDYKQTISILDNSTHDSLRNKVDNALLCAKACLKLGDIEKAKDKLIFVIANGNKLACVNEARELLKETPYSSYLNVL